MSKTIYEYWDSFPEPDRYGGRRSVKVQKIIEDEPVNDQKLQPNQQIVYQAIQPGALIQPTAVEQQPAIYQTSPFRQPAADHRLVWLLCCFGAVLLVIGNQFISYQNDLNSQIAQLKAENQALKEMATILRK